MAAPDVRVQPSWRRPPAPGDPPPADLAPPVPAAGRGPAASPIPVHDPQVEREAFLATPDPVGLYAEPRERVSPAPLARLAQRRSAKRLRLVSLLVLGLTLAGLGVADYFGAAVPVIAYAAAACWSSGSP